MPELCRYLVRTDSLFNRFSKQENYFYLSGLLIGSELKELVHTNAPGIILIGDKEMTSFYCKSCKLLGIKILEIIDANKALIKRP